MGKPQRGRGTDNRSQNTKGERRGNYRDKQMQRSQNQRADTDNVVHIGTRKPIVYLTENQRLLGSAIRANTCTFASGPAGTGKTHVAIEECIPWLLSSRKNRFIGTNPATEIGEKLGTLPGDKDDKVAVQVRPLRDILNKILGASHVDNLVESGRILFEPLGSILGTTFDDSFIVFDEAQNSTPAQMKAMLSRVGQRSKIVVAGDYREQLFIDGISGMEDGLRRLRHLHGVGHVDFTADDIIRSDFCKDVILAYRETSED
jgi:phosphate starvation-inducible PhoH-like protein